MTEERDIEKIVATVESSPYGTLEEIALIIADWREKKAEIPTAKHGISGRLARRAIVNQSSERTTSSE